MGEERFTVISNVSDELGIRENRSGDVIVLNHRDLNSEQFVGQLCLFLNDQNDTIIKLVDGAREWEEKALIYIEELEKENKELKQINNSVFKSISNRIKFWKELIETNSSNSVLQRVVEDLEDLYQLKKGE